MGKRIARNHAKIRPLGTARNRYGRVLTGAQLARTLRFKGTPDDPEFDFRPRKQDRAIVAAEEPEERKAVPIIWEIEDEDVAFANQFAVQHQPGEFVLTVGQLVPPLILGDEDDRREQLKRLSYVPVRVVGRFGLTRQRLTELIALLQENLENHDRQYGGGDPRAD
jgi:hypothetical protein